MSELAVEVRGVTRVYPGPVAALSGVDLTVAFGETLAITGPSGCGTSTLQHLLAAIDAPTASTTRKRSLASASASAFRRAASAAFR